MNKIEFLKQYRNFLLHHQLSPNNAIVGAGATLMLHDLRDKISDIDLAVPSDIFNKLSHQYGESTIHVNETTGVRKARIIKNVQSCIDVHILENVEWEIRDGIGTYTIQQVLKQKRLMNRLKDQEDIKNIEHYMREQNISIEESNIVFTDKTNHVFKTW